MSAWSEQLESVLRGVHRRRGLILPAVAAGLVLVVLVPIPPALMDVLLAGNLAAAALVLLTVIHVRRPSELSVFPSLLLLTTLVRLVLNVASTRLILTAGAGGEAPEAAGRAAGDVIWAFSHFVTADSLAVGVILFAILVVIQFVVITKGATRISEVAARFALDALPGRQAAIDADLRSEAIDADQASRRRQALAEEADFYGAMDGASKFLRGDAVAAVVITLVNVLGGLYVGIGQYGWSPATSAAVFTRLTIGDGLVTQIPAFVLSISAGLLVTRSRESAHFGEAVVGQLTARPAALGFTAGLLALLALTALPTAPLLLLAGATGGLAVLSRRRGKGSPSNVQIARADGPALPAPAEPPEEVGRLLAVEAISVELGYALVPLVEGEPPTLPQRVAQLRRDLVEAIGLVVPGVRIADTMRGGAHRYVIRLRGAAVGEGRLYPDSLLAVAEGDVTGKLLGREAVEPVTGAPAVWINPTRRGPAERMHYTVLAAAEVLVRHLREVIRRHAGDLLTRQQTVALLEAVEQRAGQVVEEVRQRLSVGRIQKVLQALLAEGRSIRDLESILEALSDAAEGGGELDALIPAVRARLSERRTRGLCDGSGRLWCVTLAGRPTSPPGTAESGPGASPAAGDGRGGLEALCQRLADPLAELQAGGRRPVVVCDPRFAARLKEALPAVSPAAAVLGYDEVESIELHPIAEIGTN